MFKEIGCIYLTDTTKLDVFVGAEVS